MRLTATYQLKATIHTEHNREINKLANSNNPLLH